MNIKKIILIIVACVLAINIESAEQSTDAKAVSIFSKGVMNNKLLLFVRKGEAGKVSQALGYGADPDALFERVPILHSAVYEMNHSSGEEKKNREKIVVLLLNECKKPDAVDAYGTTLLGKAVDLGDVALARTLLSRGADPDRSGWGYNGKSILYRAFCNMHSSNGKDKERRREIFSLALEKSKNPHVADEYGASLLTAAVCKGDVKLVRELLDRDSDLDRHYHNRYTQLFVHPAFDACCESSKKQELRLVIFGLLLEKCKNPDASDRRGMTLLGKAVRCGYTTYVQMLLARGANPNSSYSDNAKQSILYYAHSRMICGNGEEREREKEIFKLLSAYDRYPNSIRSRLLKKQQMSIADENSVDVLLRQSGLIRAKSNMYSSTNAQFPLRGLAH